MSRLYRHKVKHGLADERWKLINRYMGRSDDSRPPSDGALPLEEERPNVPLPQALADTPGATREELEAPARAAPTQPPANLSDEREQPIYPRQGHDVGRPPRPLRPQDFGAAFRTLAEIERLCEQISRLGVEGDRLRTMMADACTRLAPPS